jgi:hypothetical protein
MNEVRSVALHISSNMDLQPGLKVSTKGVINGGTVKSLIFPKITVF